MPKEGDTEPPGTWASASRRTTMISEGSTDFALLRAVLGRIVYSLACRLWTFLLGRWRRDSGREAELPRRYIIVSRHDRRRLADARRFFANAPGYEVIRDRRQGGERRQGVAPPPVDRRKRARRSV